MQGAKNNAAVKSVHTNYFLFPAMCQKSSQLEKASKNQWLMLIYYQVLIF